MNLAPAKLRFFEFSNTGLSTFDEKRAAEMEQSGDPPVAVYEIEASRFLSWSTGTWEMQRSTCFPWIPKDLT